jgi:hypothetical protein
MTVLALVPFCIGAPHSHDNAPVPADPPPCTDWPQTCPDGKSGIPRAPYKQTWMMNLSTIIMPCNNTGYTDPESTKGWGIVDFVSRKKSSSFCLLSSDRAHRR